MRKIVLTFGLIAGGILSVFLAAPFLLKGSANLEHGMLYGYATMVLSLLLIYFGVRQYRDQAGTGGLSFWKGFQVGFLIFVVAGLCYVITWEVLYRTVASGFITDYMTKSLDHARAAGATEAQLAAQRQEIAKFMAMYANPLFRAMMSFLEPLPVGVVLSLVTAGVLRRPAAVKG
ncbi:MAG: DUF4199 domain-containing protein [Holophagaceae bacterium]